MKKTLSLILCFLMIFSLAGCGGKNADGGAATNAAGDPNTLTVAIPMDIDITDPSMAGDQWIQMILGQIYETLFERDPETNELVGALCESYEYESDTSIIMHIRQGVYFHNGDELKASDVLYTMNRWKTGTCKQAGAHIDYDKTKVIDDYTLNLVLTEPFASQFALMEYPPTAILCERAVEEAGGDFSNCFVGTGAYQLVEWNRGDSIVLKAVDNYWRDDCDPIENVIMRIISDDTMRTMELETGGVDAIFVLPSADLERIEENEDLTVERDMGMNTRYIIFNNDADPWKDNVKLRQAVAYAVNREELMASWGGTGVLANGFFPNTCDGFYEIDLWEQDLDKAKELMIEAGYPDGLSISILCDTGDENVGMATILQAQLAQIGIDATVDSKDDATFVDICDNTGDFDIVIYGQTTTTMEANKAMSRWLSTSFDFVLFGWANEHFDELVNEASKTLDEEQRNELYKEAQIMLYDDCVTIPVMYRELLSASANYVKGFKNQITFENNRLRNVTFDFE